LAVIIVTGIVLQTGCAKDSRYDIQNIEKVDGSMSLFSNGVSFPLGKTEPITIEDALKMGESGLDTLFKKDKNGNYSIGAEGDQNLDEFISSLHLEDMGSINGMSFSKSVEYKYQYKPATKSVTVPVDFNLSLDFEEKDVVIISETALSQMPKEVKYLEESLFDGVNAIIEVKLTDLPEIEGEFSLKDTKVTLPSYLFGENDSNVLILDDDIKITEGTAVIQLAKLEKLKGVNLDGVKEITGDLKFSSTLYSHNPTVDITKLTATIKGTVKVGIGNGTKADHPGKIVTSKAKVKVKYDMEQSTSIALGEIPSSLQDESVNFALNPELHVSLVTNFGTPFKSDFILTPYIGGKAQETVTVKGIEMPNSDDWQKSKTNKYAIGSKVTAAADETVIAADLSPLLKRVPDSITVAVKVYVDETATCTVFPTATYSCDMSYSFQVPLSFGDGFNLSFSSDTEMSEGSGDFLKRVNVFQLKGVYETTIPLGINVDVTLLDANDKEIALKEPIKLNLQPSQDGIRAKAGEIAIVLAPTEPEKADPRKIRFNYKINASTGVNLSSKQYLKLDDLKIVLPSGIKIDASE